MAEDEAKLITRAEARAERAREKTRRWYARNIEVQRERGRVKRAKSLEKYRQHSRSYNADNLPRLAAIARNRRARKKGNGGRHTAADVEAIFHAQSKKCACCRVRLGAKYHVDHIIPIARGGSDDRKNLQILCAPCNQSKSARDPIEFMQAQGRLL